jgi:hypothetical protein
MKYLTLVFLLIGCYSKPEVSPLHNRINTIDKDKCYYISIFETKVNSINCINIKPYKPLNYNNLDTCYYNSNDTIYTYPCNRK